ncbi:MAG: DUF6399 domain-containing protein [Cyanobacteria bacterium P01_F01_bin.3]
MPNIRQRRQQVSAALSSPGYQSLRAIAKATDIPKSSVHRHQQAIEQRRQLPESGLWETAVGEQWLKRLVVGAIYVFSIKRGIGAESLSEFFHKLRLERYIGVSASSLRKLQARLEAEILTYQQQQQARLSAACEPLPELCVGTDETWFEQTVLVMMELSSGYLLVEETVDNHDYDTWQQSVQPVLQHWQGHIRYCVNDRAKALVKLAQTDLGCASIADLFHAMRKLTRGLGSELDQRLGQRRRRLKNLQSKSKPPMDEVQKRQREVQVLSTAQAKFREHLRAISTTLHPFAFASHTVHSTETTVANLTQQVQHLQHLQQTHQLKDITDSLQQFNRQINDLCAVIDVWWQWVHQAIATHSLSEALPPWLTTILLPVCYWQAQMHRADQPDLRAAYQTAYQQAQSALNTHPLTATLDGQSYRYWVSWATDMVTKFQRTTAAVEGRNGYLTQRHYNSRGLSSHCIQVMSAIHNFDLRRTDGSTAAQRLFKQAHPDLFLTVLEQAPDLPLPRQRRKAKRPIDEILDLPRVPA